MGINEFIKIGSRIKQLRIDKGISQKEMASNIGIPVSTYSNYENDYREPKAEIINRIANALDIEISDLLKSDEILKFDNEKANIEFNNDFSGTLGAINVLLRSKEYFIEAQDDMFLIVSPHYEGILATKEDIDWLEKDIRDYLQFRIDKLYEKHQDQIGLV